MLRQKLMFALLLGATCIAPAGYAPAAYAENVPFHAKLSGQSEVPPKRTDGSGDVTASLDTATNMFSYTAEWSGLSGPAVAGHFHGPAEAGANAGVAVPFPSANSPVMGSATLTDAQMADLMAGKWYANVHTKENAGGEIRGQLERGK